ncbi:hypothetical protein [Enterococcus durans]|uniref:hypothetical protein n=1 Tax=Enterococcus durans TaxID=53345 RepID=UPI0039A76100
MDEKSLVCLPLRTIINQLEYVIKEESPEIEWDTLRTEISSRFNNRIDSSFSCKNNPDIISFLKDTALINEYRHLSRTFFITDKDENWLGMFTLALKDLDISELTSSQKKKYIARQKSGKHINSIPSILLGQFAKNDKCSDFFNGKLLMSYCLLAIETIRSHIGGKLVILDSVNYSKVIQFYENYGFKAYGELVSSEKTGEVYQPMILKYEEDNYK